MSKQATQPNPATNPKKRATPQPSAETAALRAHRLIRSIDERIAAVKSSAAQKIAELTAERDATIDGLSVDTAELLVKLGVDVGGKAAE
jgi:hypothetical protein